MTGKAKQLATRGIVYVAWGRQFVQEAINSAWHVKKYMSDPITLITPEPVDLEHPFDTIIQIPAKGTYRDKICMCLSPYDHTIFLDTDTCIMDTLDELYELLERFDLVYQSQGPSRHYVIPGMPMDGFEEPSAGLIAWRKNQKTANLFEIWDAEYSVQEVENGSGAWDQRSLRAAVWKSNVQIYNLGSHWQLYSFQAGIFRNTVRMVHGRGRHARLATSYCNQSLEPRIYIPGIGFTPAQSMKPLDYLSLATRCIYIFARRLARLLLHWSGIWLIPENKRPM
jgi:hypothetical protein